MKFVPIVFLAFVGGEIAVFVVVGQRIGVVLTLLLLLASFVAGMALIRSTGMKFGQVIRQRPASAAEASRLATVAGFRMASGLLLLIPGFLTDILAAILLVPAIQHYFRGKFAGGFGDFRAEWSTGRPSQGPIIEGEAVEIEGHISDETGEKPRS